MEEGGMIRAPLLLFALFFAAACLMVRWGWR